MTTVDMTHCAPERSACPQAARTRLQAARTAQVESALAAERALVDFLFTVHPDTEDEAPGVDAQGRPRLWCSPEDFVAGLSRVAQIEVAQFLDTTIPAAMRQARRSVTTLCAMPRCASLIESGGLPVGRLWKIHQEYERLDPSHTDQFDALIAAITQGLEAKSFRTQVANAAASLIDTDPQSPARAHKARRASLRNHGDGTGTLTLNGPIQALSCSYRRGLALARAIRKSETAAGCVRDQLPPDTTVADERTVEQLVYDLYVNAPAGLDVRVDSGAKEAEKGDEAVTVRINMPTDADWLGRQAGILVTVPVMTLLGLSEAPGFLDDHSPVPAGLARLIAGDAGPFFRMLTDPVSGRGLEYPAEHYPFPAAYKRALNFTWQTCCAPGCTRRAQTCETDHVQPFDHARPERGGRTELANGIPLCKSHHQAKTERQLGFHKTTVSAAGSSAPMAAVEWSYPARIATTIVPPASPAEARQGAELSELAQRYADDCNQRSMGREPINEFDDESCTVPGGEALPNAETRMTEEELTELLSASRAWSHNTTARDAHALHLPQHWDNSDPWAPPDVGPYGGIDPDLVERAHQAAEDRYYNGEEDSSLDPGAAAEPGGDVLAWRRTEPAPGSIRERLARLEAHLATLKEQRAQKARELKVRRLETQQANTPGGHAVAADQDDDPPPF